MGGGNAQKSAAARAKKQANAPKAKGGPTGKTNAAKAFKCKRCMQEFQSTTLQSELQTHVENKHPKHDFAFSFPDYGKDTSGPVEVSEYKPDKEVKEKKKRYNKRST
eukprot:TRINITY_DN9720_c0_g1_i1.p4 TRINITY_DN9720_c0_g1~~TRINITY_DN9720_c0_g1_i1.p4  ORF type:complete len:124 (+),score=42.24 TRINITY_DN9720_c0_g1_i1:54-374(+)